MLINVVNDQPQHRGVFRSIRPLWGYVWIKFGRFKPGAPIRTRFRVITKSQRSMEEDFTSGFLVCRWTDRCVLCITNNCRTCQKMILGSTSGLVVVIRQFFTVYWCQLNSVNKCRRDQISLHFNLVLSVGLFEHVWWWLASFRLEALLSQSSSLCCSVTFSVALNHCCERDSFSRNTILRVKRGFHSFTECRFTHGYKHVVASGM